MGGQAEGHLLALALQRLALRLPRDWSITLTGMGDLIIFDETGSERFEGARALGYVVRILGGEDPKLERIATRPTLRNRIR